MHKTQWTQITAKENSMIELEELLSVEPAIARMLSRQGVRSQVQAKQFLQPALDQLHDPFRMLDMNEAVKRIQQAISQKERVLLYGDYDVDGVTSISLLYQFLNPFQLRLDYYIPDRQKEGYGLSMAGIDYAHQKNIDLIIVLDCGIKAVAPVSAAKLREIDCIICDHHIPGPVLPDAVAILNPKQPACAYPYKDLSACGIAFKLVQAMAQADGWLVSELREYLDLVAVSIAADLVPMTGENRVLAAIGLQQLQHQPCLGIAILLKKLSSCPTLQISDIVFGIGPILNAAGRMGDARLAVRLLLCNDEAKAISLAETILDYNEKRKRYDRNTVQQAKKLYELQRLRQDRSAIVLFHPNWHQGIVGIVAARLVDHYFKPTIILTESQGKAIGSARSVPGFNVYKAIKSCAKWLDSYGGHAQAAGIKLPLDNIPAFALAFEQAVAAQLKAQCKKRTFYYVEELELAEINSTFFQDLQQLAPFGPKHRSPVFVSRNIRDNIQAKVLKEMHLKLQLEQKDGTFLTAIAFKQAEHVERIRNEPFDICYTIKENYWMDRKTLQLIIKDIQFPNDVLEERKLQKRAPCNRSNFRLQFAELI